jgi:preprotein translocase subunit SecA
MRALDGRGDPGFYPERAAPREAALDRLAGLLAQRARVAFARNLDTQGPFAGEVARHAARWRSVPLAAAVPEMRYRLRRDGLAGPQLAECFGLVRAALPQEVEEPTAAALAAAQAMVRGTLVDLADPRCRWHALLFAAAAFALCGVPVHLYAASDARARLAAVRLNAPLAALGLGASCVHAGMAAAERRVAYGAAVACGTQRVIAYDYLRDRLQLGRRQRPLQSRLEHLSGDTTAGAQMLLLNGLHCALVQDADQLLLDDLRMPLVISAEVESSGDRLTYEQALELAHALEAGREYELAQGAARLSAHGAQKLAQLSVVLSGVWTARQQREELVATALAALRGLERGRDYEVAQGRLQFPAAPEGSQGGPPEALQRLLEVKEGLPFSGRREVLARLSLPQFFRRYLRLAGICGDARGLESEFWSVYGMRSLRAGWPAPQAGAPARVFATATLRRAALLASAHAQTAAGRAVVIALRTAAEGGALVALLQQQGLPFSVLRGGTPEEEREALAGLEQPGSLTLSLFPAHRGVARAARAQPPLHLVIAELHEARRHVAQMARAYAASSFEQFLDLQDEGVAARAGALALRFARSRLRDDGELPAPSAARFAAGAQRAAERVATRQRAELLLREQALEDLLSFSGRQE